MTVQKYTQKRCQTRLISWSGLWMIARFVIMIVHKQIVNITETHFWEVTAYNSSEYGNTRVLSTVSQAVFSQQSDTEISRHTIMQHHNSLFLSVNVAFSRSMWNTKRWVWNTLMLAVELTTALNSLRYIDGYESVEPAYLN